MISRAGYDGAIKVWLDGTLLYDGNYFGRAANMASRITDYARPSEVLLSEAVAESGAPAGTAFEELGVVELKEIGDPVRLFRAVRAT